MTPSTDSPAVVILDVLNLRRYRSDSRRNRGDLRRDRGDEEREPFSIQHFDAHVAAIRQRLPNVITVGIVDGTAAKFKSRAFASRDDHAELIRRSNLTPVDQQHLHLLPEPKPRWGLGTDLRYLKADPVCVHLLSKFSENGALVSGDAFAKEQDHAWFPPNHPLRANLFVPFWLRRRREWIFLARAQVQRKWDEEFFESAEQGEFLRLEQFLNSSPTSEAEFASVRQQAYGYVHDVVNEHRAAGTRVVPIVLDWQKTTAIHDLDPGMFPAAPDAPIELVKDGPIGVSGPDDSNVIVFVDTEEIDLIRSIDELQVHVGKRVAVEAMLRVDGVTPYLTWLGRRSQVRLALWSPSEVVESGFVRVEGELTTADGQLTISVDSANDMRYQSVGDAVSARLARLVKRDIYVSGGSAWTFPPLPWRRTHRIPPPPGPAGPTRLPGPGVGDMPETDQNDETTTAIHDKVAAGSSTAPANVGATTAGGSNGRATGGTGPVIPIKPPAPGPVPVSTTKWKLLAWIGTSLIVAGAVWFAMQVYVFVP